MNKKTNLAEDLTVPIYFWNRKRRETLKMINRNLAGIFPKGQPHFLFVDLGSGRGEDLIAIYQGLKPELRSRVSFTGVDAISERLEIARRDSKQKNISGINFMLHDITDRLPFEDGTVDFVYSSEVVEHLPSPESFFKEIRRILKPQGYLLMTTMNQPNFFEIEYWRAKYCKDYRSQRIDDTHGEKIVLGGKSIEIFGHISLRTIAQWDSALEAEGFRLADVARGAIRYALPEKINRSFVFRNALLLLERLLDFFSAVFGQKLFLSNYSSL